MGQKRRRLALSCVDCRRRKVKCDRTYPSCIRCQKGGQGDKCVYVPHTGPESSSAGLLTPENERRRRSQSVSTAGTWHEEAEQNEAIAHNNTKAAQRSLPPFIPPPPATQHPAYPPNLHEPPVTESRIAQLQGRLITLETVVYSAGGKPTSHEMNLGYLNPIGPGASGGRNPYSDKYQVAEQDKALLRGQSFKTQYFGPSWTGAILLQFEDLSNFVKEILIALPSLANAKLAMSKLRQREKQAAKQNYDISLESLISLVPERAYADKLLHTYLDTIETLYRIVHVPTFLKDYESYWQSPSEAKPEFIVQLLVAMSSMCCIVQGGEEGFVGRSSAKRELATYWINTASFWLESQSQKHVSLINYQLHVQLWLAKAVNTIKVKRYWTDTGGLVRLFMAAGLHREPSLLCGKINQFDCEMRRRLWYTVLELDLQCTIDRGFTPTLGPMDWDTNPPLNIDDEDINIDTQTPPEPKPRGTFTRTSFLAWAAESLPLRIEVLYKINSIRNALDHDVIMAYDMKFRQFFDEIPITGWREAARPSKDTQMPGLSSEKSSPLAAGQLPDTSMLGNTVTSKPSSLMTITLAQNVFNEFLVILHQPFPTEASFKSTHFHSRISRRHACIATIKLLNPPIARGTASSGSEAGSSLYLDEIQRRFFAFIRDDYVRAAISLAHSYVVSSAPRSEHWLLHVGDDQALITLIEAVVSMIDDRILNLGQGFHGYWTVSSALSYVHSKQSPNVPRSTFSRAAADRVVTLHSKVMDGQLPRARRLLLPTGDPLAPTPSISLNEDSLGTRLSNRTKNSAAYNAELVQSVDGVLDLQGNASAAEVDQAVQNVYGPSAGAGQMNFGVGGGAMIGFDGGFGGLGSGDFMQDTLFNFENMDWDQITNGIPAAFMMGEGDYPS